MMKGEAARQKARQCQDTVRAATTTTLGGADTRHTPWWALPRAPELCQHRDASSHARDGLPCLQEHHGQYISKEELANKKGGSKSGFKQLVFRVFFPQKSRVSPAQFLR